MKTWLITGANRGLGLEIARVALEAGDQVVATARKPDGIAAAFFEFGDRLLPIALDVTDDASISAAVEATLERFGRIDVLVNNAGYGQLGFFEQVSVDAIERQFATNVFGVFAVTRAVLPVMREQGSGHILTLSSIGGLIGFDGSSIYCATKFAIEGWSESLGLEVARFGIKATIIEPGFFRTDFLDQSSVSYGNIEIADYATHKAERESQLGNLNHRQPGDPAKLGQAVVKLVASPEPPVRFAAGSDAYEVVTDRSKSLQANADSWRDLSRSTDITA